MGDRDATSPTGGDTTGDEVYELEQWMTSPNRFWVYHCSGEYPDKKRVLLGSTNVTAVLLKNMAALKKTKDEETEEASA